MAWHAGPRIEPVFNQKVIPNYARGTAAPAQTVRESTSAQLPLFKDINVTDDPGWKIPKRRIRKFITPDDEEFWRGWERATDEQLATMEMLEEMWKAGAYDGYGEPPDEWYRKQRLRDCPYRNAVQLDFLDAYREPTVLCPVCGGKATELIDGLCPPCDEFRPRCESV